MKCRERISPPAPPPENNSFLTQLKRPVQKNLVAQFREVVTWLHACRGVGRPRGTLCSPCPLVLSTEVGRGVVSYPCLSSWVSLKETRVQGSRGWHSGLISPFSSKAKGPQVGCLHAPPCGVVSQPLCCALGHLSLGYPSEVIWKEHLTQHVGCGNEELVTGSDETDCWNKTFLFFPSWTLYQEKNSHGKAVFWQPLQVRSLSSPSHSSLNGKFYG